MEDLPSAAAHEDARVECQHAFDRGRAAAQQIMTLEHKDGRGAVNLIAHEHDALRN